MAEQTVNPIPTAGSNFLEVLQAFLQNEDADRFELQFYGFVVEGGTHGTVAGLTATPDPLTAFPGGFYVTETGSITYPDNSTVNVIASSGTTGDLGGYTRVSGTHYLIAVQVGPLAAALPDDCVRLMNLVTAGGAITTVYDVRQLSPLVNKGDLPYVRLIGSADLKIQANGGILQVLENTSVEDDPVWEVRIGWGIPPTGTFAGFSFPITAGRTYTFPDKDGTVAMTSDIAGSAFAAGTRLLFDNDAAPTGWVRDISLTINDKIPRIVTGARADGGSWTISGLNVASHTHDLGNHQHDSPTSGSDGVTMGYNAKTAGWSPGASANTYTMDRGGAIDAEATVNALLTGTPSTNTSGATAPGISSDASWRPLNRAVILCEKS